jgi:hypothetical protein
MSNQTQECIEEYIKTKHEGGLIGISKLTKLCNQPVWEIYSVIKNLESEGKVKITTRYFYPEIRRIPDESVPFCHECDLKYTDSDIITLVYIEPT